MHIIYNNCNSWSHALCSARRRDKSHITLDPTSTLTLVLNLTQTRTLTPAAHPQHITTSARTCRWNQHTYSHITEHYRWAFDQLFSCAGFAKVLVLEDDMLLAPDFFAYFEATAKLLDQVRTSG